LCQKVIIIPFLDYGTKENKNPFTTSNFDTAGSNKVLYDLAKGFDEAKFEVAFPVKLIMGLSLKNLKDWVYLILSI
jgi:hypothetical protein